MFDSADRSLKKDAFVLRAIVASDEVSRIVKANPNGHVHSVFTTSFNLTFGGHLVHVGALGNGIAPFGIGLEQADAHLLTALVAAGLEVAWDEKTDALHFPKGILLALKEAERSTHKMQPYTYNARVLEENFKFLAGRLLQDDWTTGFAETQEEKELIIHYIVDPSSSVGVLPVLAKLDSLKKLVTDQEMNAEEVFDYWIGRGLGLTPSGDDCITGVCAVLSALEGTDRTLLQRLKPYLDQHGQIRTTSVALEYLLYATENKFHSHLLQLCVCLDKPRGPEFMKAVEELKEIGHTSGADTLVGMLIGMKAAVIHQKER